MNNFFCILIICVCVFIPLKLCADTGETGASFLNLGVGASSISMGGAVTSLSTGVHSLFWNPGGLGWLRGTEATIMHAEHFQAIRYGSLGLAHGTNTLSMGFSVRGLYLGEMEERTHPSENPLSTFGACFIAPSLSVAKFVTNNISLGTSIKLIYQAVGDDDAVSFGNDIGVSAKAGIEGLRAGLVLTNWGTKIRFANSSFSLPTRVKMGLSYSPFNENVSFCFDLVKPFKENIECRLGAQGVVRDKFCLRAGYRSGLQNSGSFEGISAGAGFKIKDIDIDYAFSGYGVLGLTHTFSISYIFGRMEIMKKDEEMRIAEKLQQRASLTAKAFYRQGVTLQNEGKYEKAMKNFDMALIWDPTYDAALRSLESVEKKMKKREMNELLQKGIADFDQGNYIDAVSEFGCALEIEPTNETARGWLKTASDALVKIQMERMKFEKEADEKASEYIKSGLESFSRKEYSKAIDEWNKVISLAPTHREAREWIQKAQLKIEQQMSEALKRVDLSISQGKWISALNEVNRVLALDPNNTHGLSKKQEIKKNLRNLSADRTETGIKLYKQGKFGLAEAEFKMALNFDKGNTTAKKYSEKVKSNEKEVSGEDVNELYMKGVNAYTQENYRMAVFYWRRVLQIDPDHVNAKRNIERAEEKLKISTQ